MVFSFAFHLRTGRRINNHPTSSHFTNLTRPRSCHAYHALSLSWTMVRTLPWLVGNSQTSLPKKKPVATRPVNRKRPILDEDSDGQTTNSTGTASSSKRRQHDKAARSSSPGSPQPSRAVDRRTPSSSPPPTAPPVEFMQPNDEKWMMVEDELCSIASTFTRHLHAEEYKRLKKLAAQKSVSTVAALPRPTDSVTALSKEAQMRKRAEEKREHMKKVAANHPGRNETPGSDEEHSAMLFTDRHLAGLMQGSPGARRPKRILHITDNKSHTRAAAGYTKQEDGSPSRPKARQRLPDLGDFMMSRRKEANGREKSPSRPPKATIKQEKPSSKLTAVPSKQYEEDEDDDDLDAIVPIRKSSASVKVATTKSSSSSMAPPTRDRPESLRGEMSSTSSQSKTTYPRPALKRESSSPGSPPKKTAFSDTSTQSSSRRSLVSSVRPSTSMAVEKKDGEFAFMDLGVSRSKLLPSRKGNRYGHDLKQTLIKEEKAIKLEEIPYL